MTGPNTTAGNGLDPKALDIEGADGVRIRVWDHGGAGPALVLTHCTGTHARMWDPLVPGLLDRFHVYAVGTRGHGDSDKPQDPEAYRGSASGRDLIAVVDALSPGAPVRAAGHSAGAAHICYAALERPEQYESAVLMDAIIGPKQDFTGESELAWITRRRRNVFRSVAQARENFASKAPMNTWHPAVLDAYVNHAFNERADGLVELKCPGEIEAWVYDGGGSPDVFERLGELKFKALLVTGTGSNTRMLAELQRERMKDAEFLLMEDTSHFIPQERPDEVVELIHSALA